MFLLIYVVNFGGKDFVGVRCKFCIMLIFVFKVVSYVLLF